jgi:hypothetical protein
VRIKYKKKYDNDNTINDAFEIQKKIKDMYPLKINLVIETKLQRKKYEMGRKFSSLS